MDECTKYEVVTSNANLNEMTRQALSDYLAVFQSVLAPDGIFLVQCTGFTGNGTEDTLYDVLTEAGWAPVFCAIAGESTFKTSKGNLNCNFPLNNIVMVRPGHPLHTKAYGRSNFSSGFMVAEPWIERMFFGSPSSKYTRTQVIEMVKVRLKKLTESGALLPDFPAA